MAYLYPGPGHGAVPAIYTQAQGYTLLAILRFLWNSTRGHRLAFWRSDFLRWRVETFTGKQAESLTTKDIFLFLWKTRWEFFSYLAWVGRMDREARKRA